MKGQKGRVERNNKCF